MRSAAMQSRSPVLPSSRRTRRRPHTAGVAGQVRRTVGGDRNDGRALHEHLHDGDPSDPRPRLDRPRLESAGGPSAMCGNRQNYGRNCRYPHITAPRSRRGSPGSSRNIPGHWCEQHGSPVGPDRATGDRRTGGTGSARPAYPTPGTGVASALRRSRGAPRPGVQAPPRSQRGGHRGSRTPGRMTLVQLG